ncbi:MAG TPA: NifU N-terminal domain-containing protein [Rubricoccaceae bacterium]|nr:NifU N-terminal domain-containing protein [Rubricoccaceae bacterium]
MPAVTPQPTPNPDSLKFVAASGTFLDSGMRAFGSVRDAEGDPLGAALFALDGVANVFVTPGFVTVTKQPAASWNGLTDGIQRVLEQHLAAKG